MSDQLSLAQIALRPYERSAHEPRATDADTGSVRATAPSALWLRLSSRRLGAASDERVIAALRGGDERAFEALYDRYHRQLLAFCRQMLGSREEAEDALQHVFVSAHGELREGSRRVQLKPWLYAIARNRCLSMLRARRDVWAIEHAEQAIADGLEVAGEVERKEELAEILGDLARLPDDQRAALVLAELGDLSHQEIAAALAVRTDKVKGLIFQARDALAGWRQARGADCCEIQEQLATLRGSSLRRAPIRRHVALCDPCAAFEREVARQRAALALALPAVPTAALKHSVIAAALSAGHGTGTATAAATAGVAVSGAAASGIAANLGGGGASALTVKALTVIALGVGAGGGGALAVRALDPGHALPRSARTPPAHTPASGEAPAAPVPASARAQALRSAFLAASHRRATAERPSRDDHGSQRAASGSGHHGPPARRASTQSRTSSQPALKMHPTKPTHPGKSAVKTHPTKPTHPGKSAVKTHPTKPTHPGKSAVKTHPTKPTHPVKSAPKTSQQPRTAKARSANPAAVIAPTQKDSVLRHEDAVMPDASPGKGGGTPVAGRDTGG